MAVCWRAATFCGILSGSCSTCCTAVEDELCDGVSTMIQENMRSQYQVEVQPE